MTKGRFHIGKNGPAPCNADKGICPYGGESGHENHFETLADAQTFYENKLDDEFGGSLAEPERVNPISKLSKKEQNDLAKETDDPEVLKYLSKSDSKRIRGSVLKNERTDADVLKSMYDHFQSEGSDERLEVLKNSKMELNNLSDEDFKDAVSDTEGLKRAVLSDDFDDRGYRLSRSEDGRTNIYIFKAAYRNKNNKLSEEARREMKADYPGIQSVALLEEEVDSDEIRGFSPDALLTSVEPYKIEARIEEETSPEKLDALYSVLEKANGDEYAVHHMRSSFFANENTKSETLARAADRIPKDWEWSRRLAVSHPNMPEDKREKLSKVSEGASNEYEFFKKKGVGTNAMRKAVEKQVQRDRAMGMNQRTVVTLDSEKIKELNLSADDINTMYEQFGGTYREETGQVIYGGGYSRSL